MTAVTTRDVRKDGAVAIPKGAVLSGRLTRAERREARMGEYLVLGFRFDRVEFEGKRASFTGTLEDAGIAMGSRYFLPFAPRFGQGPSIWSSVAQTPMAPPGAGEGVLFVRGGHQRVSSGLRLVWKTVSGGE